MARRKGGVELFQEHRSVQPIDRREPAPLGERKRMMCPDYVGCKRNAVCKHSTGHGMSFYCKDTTKVIVTFPNGRKGGAVKEKVHNCPRCITVAELRKRRIKAKRKKERGRAANKKCRPLIW